MEKRIKLLCLWLCVMFSLGAYAQETDSLKVAADLNATAAEAAIAAQDSASATPEVVMPGQNPKPSKYVALEGEQRRLLFFQGFTLSVDLLGAGTYLLSDYGNFEAALRISLKNTYFPIAELGYALCETTDYNTKVYYQTKAPYMRVGLDYNLLKNKFEDNRLFIGLRYGLSRFNYDIAGPAQTDPIWGGTEEFNLKGISCTSHWAELVFGVQVKILSMFHMGWSVRYKKQIHNTKSIYTTPCYIPGYGKTTWSGTYNLIFDLNWGKGKTKKVELLKAQLPQQ